MTQDTRKDPRAKIVSLNVRYKSATVDEFIENHSYDVSKGGIFIKTPSPFPPGTLLKFEIRIAGDKAVISGVGRVVWKREAGQSTTERPSGMGVKFIKLDDSSRAVIDKLIEAKGPDAGNAFEEGNTEAPPLKPPPPGVAAAGTPFDLAPSTKIQSAPAHAEPAAPPKGEPAGAIARKPAHTMIGVGQPAPKQASPTSPAAPQAPPAPAAGRPAAPPPPRRPAPEPPPRPAGGVAPAAKPAEPAAAKPAASVSSMFPKTDSLKEMPPTGEQTVMKQAAELLEEALRGAGGSMDEIGSNPLFDVAMKSAPPTGGGATPTPIPEPPKAEAKAELDPDAAMRPTPLPPEPEPVVAAKPPASPEPPPAAVPKREAPRESARPKPAEPARPVARAFVDPTPPPGGGNRALMGFVALVAVGVIGYFAYTQLLDTGSPTPADSTNVATSSQTPPPPVSAAPAESAVAMPSASAASSATAPAASASGGAPASASGAPVTSAAAASVAAPPPVKPPPVAPPPVKPPPVAPPPVAPPPVTVKPVVAPAPVAPKPVTPRPRKPADDDNPY